MKARSLSFAGLLLLLAGAGWSQTPAVPDWRMSISRNVFEVVLRKPEADPFVYQEKLPLDLLPYAERTDTQYSIGTAFAIGHGRFVSAAHVFSLESLTLRNPIALRDSTGTVRPVGNVVAYSSRRDYVVFEVPGLEAEGLSLAGGFSLNTRVYAAGNALGEGVVIRDGLLTSATPEERNGDWKWLRFSAAASPGNSGGPLLDENGRVIGIVTRKSESENLNYALPISELDLSPVAVEDIRGRYHLPNLTRDAPIEGVTSFPLPMPVDALRQKVHAYSSGLTFAAADTITKDRAALFPMASGSGPSIGNSPFTTLPRFVAQQPDGTWQVQGVDKPSTARVGEQGSLQYGALWRYTVFSLSKPPDAQLPALFSKPRNLMDMFLQGAPWYRTIATRQIRITSFGDPSAVDRFEDAYGRRWMMARWDIPWADISEVLMALPVPGGAVGVFVQSSYAEWPDYEYDIRFLANYLALSYAARLKDWEELLAAPDLRPRLFDSLQLTYTPGRSLLMDTPRFTLAVGADLLAISDESRLALTPAYYREAGAGAWDAASIALAEPGTGKTYVAIGKVVRPEPGAADQARQTWTALSSDTAPFTGTPRPENGVTTMLAARHPAVDGKAVPDPGFQYVTILGIEGSPSAADAQSRFNLLKNGFSLKSFEVASAQSGAAPLPPSASGLAVENGKTIFQAISTGDEQTLKAFIADRKDLEQRNDDRQTPLLLALRLGKKDLAADLLAAGVPADGVDRLGNSALVLALRNTDADTARAVIQRGTDISTPDANGFTPLMIAMSPQFGDLPALLVGQGADIRTVSTQRTSALTFALLNGRGALAVDLVKKGAALDLTDRNGWTELMYALRYADPATVQFLIDHGCPTGGTNNEGWTALHFAARYGTGPIVALLLGPGGAEVDTPNKTGVTALMLAAGYGAQESVQALLDRGADPRARDGQGWTALSWALRYGNEARARVILGRLDRMPEKNNDGWSALHFAARYMPSMVPAVAALAGAEVNGRVTGGWTPLLLATENGSVPAVQWLLANGADPSMRKDDGKTALDLAQAEGKKDLVAVLQGTPSVSDYVSMLQGDTRHLSVAGAADQTLTWTTSNAGVATVDAGGVVTALGAGTAIVSAAASGGTTTKYLVSVWAPDGSGYLQFKADEPLSEGWWDRSPPDARGMITAGSPTSVSVNKVSGASSQGFGFQFCYQDSRNFYLILVNTSGQFSVRKSVAGTSTTLVPWTSNPALRAGFGQANKITVARTTRSFFVVTFNDELAKQVAFTDSSFESGYLMYYATVGAQESFPTVPEDVRFKLLAPAPSQ